MGLTKEYLAYRPVDSFNIISSGRANVNFVIYNSIEGRYVLTAAAENAIIWDLRLCEKVMTLRREKHEVTALRVSPDRMHVAAGYADGVVEIFDMNNPEQAVCSLALHRSASSILRYDEMGIRLISGSLDTELVVVDVVEQAGRQRLIGHNGAITDAHFLERFAGNIAVSSSKDMQIKFWNLHTQFCFQTVVDNRTEVWSLALIGNLMVAGNSENTMNVYRLTTNHDNTVNSIAGGISDLTLSESDSLSPILVSNIGHIQRVGKGRTVNLISDPNEQVICCHGTDGLIESFYFFSDEEAKVRLLKRLKKAKKITENSEIEQEVSESPQTSLVDKIKRLAFIKTKQKIKSLDVLKHGVKEIRILVSSANNSLQLYNLDMSASFKQENKQAGELLRSLTRMGHQSEVRSVCFTSDSLAIGSGSAESFKFWNRESMQCLRTVQTNYILCTCFVPGDRYILIGLKNGKLLIVDVGAGETVEEIEAHESEINAITLLPDQKGCITGSNDKTVKIWTFELIDVEVKNENEGEGEDSQKPQETSKILSLLNRNTLTLDDSVLCLRVSPDMKYLAVGLLDSTVKIFFLDTLKFHLLLYGHKLQVLCLDISHDSELIVTGSADRNVKIWGLNYGDIHRSIFAHDNSVMAVQFIPNTHMFFSCGKDGKIKQWDADNFEKIITLSGHIGEAYNLAISPNGRFLVTCGSDRTLRLYEKTEELLVLEDVQEEEREEIENQQLATGEDSSVPLLPGLKLPSRKTIGSEKSVESILECLEISKQFEMDAVDKPDPHPLMKALNVTNTTDFLLVTLSRIRASDLEEALLLLPFINVAELFERLPVLVQKRSDELELLCKVTSFLFKVHLKTILNTKSLKPCLKRLIKLLESDIENLRDIMGMNLHGLLMLERDIEEREGVELFRDAQEAQKKKETKKRAAIKRLHMQIA